MVILRNIKNHFSIYGHWMWACQSWSGINQSSLCSFLSVLCYRSFVESNCNILCISIPFLLCICCGHMLAVEQIRCHIRDWWCQRAFSQVWGWALRTRLKFWAFRWMLRQSNLRDTLYTWGNTKIDREKNRKQPLQGWMRWKEGHVAIICKSEMAKQQAVWTLTFSCKGGSSPVVAITEVQKLLLHFILKMGPRYDCTSRGFLKMQASIVMEVGDMWELASNFSKRELWILTDHRSCIWIKTRHKFGKYAEFPNSRWENFHLEVGKFSL